ncbi:MAG: T9SS type A sorting domain-containing protein [Gilvibacter sp.]
MKRGLFILCVFQIGLLQAQFGPQQIITTEAQLARDVFATDIDGDGDMDALSANRSSSGAFNIAWYENLDGLGSFGSPNVIDVFFQESHSVRAADLDNDGDMDIIATSASLDRLVWYENLDGLGNFSNDKIISTTTDGAFSAIAIDIDNDGDLDVVSSSDNSGLAWHENLDGLGTFSAAITVSSTINNNRSVFAADIDNDGDFDLVASASGSVIVFWFENLDGLGTFSAPLPIAPVSTPASSSDVFAIDIDGDTDLDVLSIPALPRRLVWYENLDGVGTFGPEQIIAEDLITSLSLYSTDLDNDGDNDVLYTSTPSSIENTSVVGWCENLDGLGNFGPKQAIINTLTFATSVYSSDIDNDGDMDVLSASQNDDTIAWYENLTILGVNDNELTNFTIYPNPSSEFLFISESHLIQKVEVFDLLGKKMNSFKEDFEQLDIANLRSGLYLIKIYSDNTIYLEKFIKK